MCVCEALVAGVVESVLCPPPQTRGEYGADVMKEARPLPLEYLIIELTTTTPRNPQPLLPGGREPAFPVEHRAAIGQPVQVRVCAVCVSQQ